MWRQSSLFVCDFRVSLRLQVAVAHVLGVVLAVPAFAGASAYPYHGVETIRDPYNRSRLEGIGVALIGEELGTLALSRLSALDNPIIGLKRLRYERRFQHFEQAWFWQVDGRSFNNVPQGPSTLEWMMTIAAGVQVFGTSLGGGHLSINGDDTDLLGLATPLPFGRLGLGGWGDLLAHPFDTESGGRRIQVLRGRLCGAESTCFDPIAVFGEDTPGMTYAFGTAIAFRDAQTLAVSDPGAEAGAGRIHIFKHLEDEWVWTASVAPPEPQPGSYFGLSIAFAGGDLVIGSPAYDSGRDAFGRIDILREHDGAGAAVGSAFPGADAETTVAPGSDDVRDFGWSIAGREGRIAIGAPKHNASEFATLPTRRGEVYLFDKNVAGDWFQVARLAPARSDNVLFGFSVAINEDRLIVGSPGADRVYLYRDDCDRDARGDANGDGLVLFDDLNIVLNNYGAAGEDLPGDLDGSGVVDFVDLNIVLATYGSPCL